MTKTTKKKQPEMTLAEIRAELKGKEKEVFVQLSSGSGLRNGSYGSKPSLTLPDFLDDKTPDQIAAFLNKKAKEAGLDKVELSFRKIPVTKERLVYQGGRYVGYGSKRRYESGKDVKKVTTEQEGPYWVLVGYQPYTDDELLELGPKLVAAKRKKEAAELKKLQTRVNAYNKSATELGIPTITVDDIRNKRNG